MVAARQPLGGGLSSFPRAQARIGSDGPGRLCLWVSVCCVALVGVGCPQYRPVGFGPAAVDAGEDAGRDAGLDAGEDAGIDAGADAGTDAGEDAGVDAGEDAGIDAGEDAGLDAGQDAGPDAGPLPELDGGLPPGCVPGTQYVFVFGEDDTLYRFFPPTLSFEEVGQLSCPDAQGTPNSMAVERGGRAWLNFTDGSLFTYDTGTGACAATSFAIGQNGFQTFGMGFSSDIAGTAQETLYVSSGESARLGSIDRTTLVLTSVGPYAGLVTDANLTGRAEMSGTGEGRLFGMFEGSPFVVSEIDKTDAAIISSARQNGVGNPNEGNNFAFAQWGGNFWLFVGQGGATSIYKYDPVAQMTTQVSLTGIEIVGAGVSTCVPTQ